MMLTKRLSARRLLGAALALALTACGSTGNDSAYQALRGVLATEDARPSNGIGRAPLVEALAHADAETRRFAVRALGRLEDPELVSTVAALLNDADASVRSAAAFAVAQSVHGADGSPALEPLMEAAGRERHPAVRGNLARALGRIRPGGTAPDAALPVLTGWVAEANLAAETALGIVLGLESLSRASGAPGTDPKLYEALTVLARRAPASADEAPSAAKTRAVAVLALGQRGRLDRATLHAAMQDEDASVRAAAARYLGTEPPEGERTERLLRALGDVEPIVRIAAVGVLAASERNEHGCDMLLERATTDGSTGVRLVALDALREPCPGALGHDVVAHLGAVARNIPPAAEDEWRPAIHALRSLAERDPEQAMAVLPMHRDHASPFVRATAAEVAGMLADRVALDVLVRDADPNVRTAALPGVAALDARAAHELAVAQLEMNDGQLLITAAGLIDRVPDPAVAEAVMGAFDRLSAGRRETARDARMAMLDVLADAGDASLAARLDPYLDDYDAAVAEKVAVVLEVWRRTPHEARPSPSGRLALPTIEQLAQMDGSVVVLHMASGGEVGVELFPMLAPTNAFRFFRLASEGYFDGLTLHRWVPNFVIQGGSPAANEYAGDGPYTRDEIGTVSHWRGTIGLSTRGRDTGDGQIFVNLVHNVRLDYDYTVFGAVITGMDVVDALLTGDVIQRTEIRRKD